MKNRGIEEQRDIQREIDGERKTLERERERQRERERETEREREREERE